MGFDYLFGAEVPMTRAQLDSFISATIVDVEKRLGLEPSKAPACEQCGSICKLYQAGHGNFCLHCAIELFG
jgi:hypothetical protein